MIIRIIICIVLVAAYGMIVLALVKNLAQNRKRIDKKKSKKL